MVWTVFVIGSSHPVVGIHVKMSVLGCSLVCKNQSGDICCLMGCLIECEVVFLFDGLSGGGWRRGGCG